MSMITTMVVSRGIVMAADSANSISERNNENDVGRVISKSFEKLYTLDNIGISTGNEWITSDGKPIHPYIDYFIANNSFTSPCEAASKLLVYI